MHYIWAIFYMAERRHLIETGAWMVWDDYVAMRHGPVPLRTFSEFHDSVGKLGVGMRYASPGCRLKKLAACYQPHAWNQSFTLLELACLEFAFLEARRLGCAGLERMVRGVAWRMAGPDGMMDPLEVAREGQAQQAELNFIQRWRDPPYRMEVG